MNIKHPQYMSETELSLIIARDIIEAILDQAADGVHVVADTPFGFWIENGTVPHDQAIAGQLRDLDEAINWIGGFLRTIADLIPKGPQALAEHYIYDWTGSTEPADAAAFMISAITGGSVVADPPPTLYPEAR